MLTKSTEKSWTFNGLNSSSAAANNCNKLKVNGANFR